MDQIIIISLAWKTINGTHKTIFQLIKSDCLNEQRNSKCERLVPREKRNI